MSEPLTALLGLERAGDDTVVADVGLTRSELWERSAELAAHFSASVAPDERVGLVDRRDAASLVALVAALRSETPVAMLGVGDYGAPAAALAERARCRLVVAGNDMIRLDPSADGASSPRFGLTATDSPEAVVLFTSGTTGAPKGVRLSRSSILSNLTAMLRITESWSPDDRLGQVLTTSHSFGLSMALMALARDVPIVFLPDGPPSRGLVELMDLQRVSIFACVPYLLRLMGRRNMSLGGTAAPHLRRLFLAGGGLGDGEIEQLLPDFAGSLYLMYGFTETTARAAVRRYGDGAPSESVGLPLPGTHIDVVTPQGSELRMGEEGLIRATSPSLMIGYLGEEPRRRGAPFTTSDLGRLDAAGNLFITGRDVEMMNFRGNRVSVVRLEAQAMATAGVLDARAVPDSRAEDAQCVLRVVLRPDADLSAVRLGIINAVEPRGIIRQVDQVDSLPRTRSGKAIRY